MQANKSFSSLTECCGERQTCDTSKGSIRVRFDEGKITVECDEVVDDIFTRKM